MRLGRAFLIVSFYSYMAMLMLLFMDYRVLVDPVNNGNAIYLGVFLGGMILYGLRDNTLNLMWAGIYAAMALNSFLGLIQWVNHLNGTNINLYMCLWDLLIGTAFVLESDLYVD